jgi:UDP-GlcNAc:undecaprenyl-phosphate GlcNAc-1-phosphate transferase
VSDEAHLATAFALAFVLALALTPLARRLAIRTQFLDHPSGYKSHAASTPYLGGVAVVVATLVSTAAFGLSAANVGLIGAGVLLLFLVGTMDDRRGLDVWVRFAAQGATGVAVWVGDMGWTIFEHGVLNLAITLVWVVGLVNAFNLMDNLDGAAASVGATCAAGAGALAAIEGNYASGAIAFALAGACIGFLPYNLAKPARIFLGDGGSMPIGFLVAISITAIPELGSAAYVLLALVPLAGLPILDTTLVVVSRWRRGMPVLSGARDHITHRLHGRLGSPMRVCLMLVGLQMALSAIGFALYQFSEVTIIAATCGYLVVALAGLRLLETLAWATDGLPPVKVRVRRRDGSWAEEIS